MKPQCDACSAVIGELKDYPALETDSYPVGEYHICNWCWLRMSERGCIQLLHHSAEQGVRYLYPDGQVIKKGREESNVV